MPSLQKNLWYFLCSGRSNVYVVCMCICVYVRVSNTCKVIIPVRMLRMHCRCKKGTNVQKKTSDQKCEWYNPSGSCSGPVYYHPSWGRTEQKELKRSPLDLALFFRKEGIADGKVCILYISITRYRSWLVTAETDDGLDRGVSRSMERDKTTPVTLLVLIWCIVLFILIGKG